MISYNYDTYCADFETTSYQQYKVDGYTRVWLWDMCRIKDLKHTTGTTIETMFDFLNNNKRKKTLLFHNLKFDGRFIIDYLLRIGYTLTPNKDLGPREFSTLISGANTFFTIEIRTEKCLISIFDSLLKIPLSVANIPSAFNFENIMTKGDIDYIKYRGLDYEPDDNELSYVHRDTEIVARAMQVMFGKKLFAMTQSSDSLAYYKRNFKYYDTTYPKLDFDTDALIREAYRGGWTYLKPEWADKDIGMGISYDVNSLYPSVMVDSLLPYDEPVPFTGKYQDDVMYPLYIVQILVNCDLKPKHLPTIQVKTKNCWRVAVEEEFLHTTNNEMLKLTVTSIDLKLLFAHYDIHEIEYLGGFKFKGSTKLYTDYIEEMNYIKTHTTDKGERTLAKLKMNSLYGKFGTNPRQTSKVPYYDEEKHLVSYSETVEDITDGVYIPAACFITAYAKYKTITSAQKVYDRFVYADTDSIHLIGTEEADIDIDPKRLGAWKNEGIFLKARFLKSKTYMKQKLDDDGNIYYDVKCAGLSKEIAGDYSKVNFDNFHIGLRVPGGRKMLATVPGGCVIKELDFNIR